MEEQGEEEMAKVMEKELSERQLETSRERGLGGQRREILEDAVATGVQCR